MAMEFLMLCVILLCVCLLVSTRMLLKFEHRLASAERVLDIHQKNLNLSIQIEQTRIAAMIELSRRLAIVEIVVEKGGVGIKR
jgi:hypothetical protein